MNVLIIISIIMMFDTVDSWSTFHRSDRYKYVADKWKNTGDHSYYKVAGKPFKECKDKVSSAICYKYQKLCEDRRMYKICKRTCGTCPAVSPLSCQASHLGCCWDNITKVEHGCPACKDSTKSCRKSFPYCGHAHIQRACPETCRVCSDCSDDEHQAEFCPYWKTYGMCTQQKELMQKYCQKTCELCEKPKPVIDQYYYHKRESDDVENMDADEAMKARADDALMTLLLGNSVETKSISGKSDQGLADFLTNHHQVKTAEIEKKDDNVLLEHFLKGDSSDKSKKAIQDNNVQATVVTDDNIGTNKKKESVDNMEQATKIGAGKNQNNKKSVDNHITVKEDLVKKQTDVENNSLNQLLKELTEKEELEKEDLEQKENTKADTSSKKEAENKLQKLLLEELSKREDEEQKQKKNFTPNKKENTLFSLIIDEKDREEMDKRTLANDALLQLLVQDGLKKEKQEK